jgi:hypothetical protein
MISQTKHVWLRSVSRTGCVKRLGLVTCLKFLMRIAKRAKIWCASDELSDVKGKKSNKKKMK